MMSKPRNTIYPSTSYFSNNYAEYRYSNSFIADICKIVTGPRPSFIMWYRDKHMRPFGEVIR